MKFKKENLEKIQIDYGIVFVDYGLATERRLGPTRGGALFEANATYRDIEFDGRKGRTMGLRPIDEIEAVLRITAMDISQDNLQLAMPYLTLNESTQALECKTTPMLDDSAYMSNMVMFAKLVDGGYKKITLYNALNEGAFSLNAAPKAEGTVAMEVYAHWDPVETDLEHTNIDKLFQVEEVSALA